ncbi:MAG: TPM domain-containing protein [Oxalobacteraceae bacterium]|nr:TPM domain-containing protein [Oxalobacteraceae bacterium]
MTHLFSLLARLKRHLLTTSGTARRAFPPSTLHAIEATIAAGETLHRAEVCLIIEPSLTPTEVLQQVSARDRARELFALHRIWDTEENCGVLIYVNLADHKVEIVTDRAVGRLIDASHWQAICHTMTDGFSHGEFQHGVNAALKTLNALLQQHYPSQGARGNQLGNRPVLL